MREELMRIHYNNELASYFGRDKTETLLCRKYWQPMLSRDVAERVRTCVACQTIKLQKHRPYSKAQVLLLPQRLQCEITIDFITNLLLGKYYSEVVDLILVVVDRYTKMVVYIPTTKRCTSIELAKLLIEDIVQYYNIPEGIVTDRGSIFTSKYQSNFAFEVRVKHKLSTAFHLQTNSQIEQMNQSLEQYLRCYLSKA